MATGRVDRVNSFGAQAITSNTDLNDISDPGIYGCASATIAGSLSHCPFTTAGFTLLILPKGSYFTQVIFTGAYIYSRTKGSSGFAAWRVASLSTT